MDKDKIEMAAAGAHGVLQGLILTGVIPEPQLSVVVKQLNELADALFPGDPRMKGAKQ